MGVDRRGRSIPRRGTCRPDRDQTSGCTRDVFWRTQGLQQKAKRTGSLVWQKSATPKGQFFAFNHHQDPKGCTPEQLLDNLKALGLDVRPACGSGFGTLPLSPRENPLYQLSRGNHQGCRERRSKDCSRNGDYHQTCRPLEASLDLHAHRMNQARMPAIRFSTACSAGLQALRASSAPRFRAMTSRRSSMLTGLLRKSFMPASRQLSFTPARVWPVRAMMTGWWPRRKLPRISRVARCRP